MFWERQPRRRGGSKPGGTLGGAGVREVKLQHGGHPLYPPYPAV